MNSLPILILPTDSVLLDLCRITSDDYICFIQRLRHDTTHANDRIIWNGDSFANGSFSSNLDPSSDMDLLIQIQAVPADMNKTIGFTESLTDSIKSGKDDPHIMGHGQTYSTIIMAASLSYTVSIKLFCTLLNTTIPAPRSKIINTKL